MTEFGGYKMSEPSPELIDELFRDKVRAARRMSPEEKLLAGPQLFDYTCKITMSGIRVQHPNADERRVRELLRERLALAQRLERAS